MEGVELYRRKGGRGLDAEKSGFNEEAEVVEHVVGGAGVQGGMGS